jgi:hypothetical protein
MGAQGIISGEISTAARAAGRVELTMNPAGQIAGMLSESRPAREILDGLVADTVRVLSEDLPRRVEVTVRP